MPRNFYSFAIFFTGLYIAVTLFQSIILFQIGANVFQLDSLFSWIILVSLISLSWSLVMLKYYHFNQYTFTFWTAVISTVASLFHFIAIYQILTEREMSGYYFFTTLIVQGTSILNAITLIFSDAGRRSWLKAAGVFSLFFGIVSMIIFIWAITSVDARLNGTIQKAEQWMSLIGSFVPVLFIMNFLHERSTAKKGNTSSQESLTVTMGIVACVAVVSTLIIGPRLAFQRMEISRNPNNVSEDLRILARPFEARTYVNGHGDTLRYRLLPPLDYDSTKNYPLVVCLHGSSGCGTDNVKQVATSWPAQVLSSRENRLKYPSFLFVPQCPPESVWGGISNITAVDSLVFETILALEAELPIDVKKCYVSGNSLGGYGTWHFISTHPEMFAAAIPISGGGDPKLAQKIAAVPVWAFHGRKDKQVPVSGSQDIIAAMKKVGGNPRYTEFPDEGHHIWQNVTDTPGLLDWLFVQERD